VNRERLLFAGVVALIALWYFVLREDPKFLTDSKIRDLKVEVIETRAAPLPTRELRMPAPYGAFTRVTNERENPRPMLPAVEARELPNIRIPTTRSVRRSLFGRLRQPTVAPIDGEATIELPAIEADGSNADGGENVAVEGDPREDGFTALNNPQVGKVVRIRKGRQWIKDPGDLPMPGPLGANDFYYLLALTEVDPVAAEKLGVNEIEVSLKLGGKATVSYPFPGEINTLSVANAGTEKPFWDGLKGYLRLPEKGVAPRETYGDRMLAAGVAAGGLDPRLRWAMIAFREARQQENPANQQGLKKILLKELDAANRLFEYERVLELAFEHLSRFPGEAEVLEIVGTLMASRTFGLLEQAEQWFEKAPQSTTAQLKRVEVLIRLDRFADARKLIEDGRAGAGPAVNLLLARTALAQGDYATATTKASAYTIGEHAAEGNLILGGIAYVQNNLDKAIEHFTAAVQASPNRSSAYSDLGLALVAAGRLADAEKCFARAEALDFENTVVPGLGRAYGQFAAADAAALKAAAFRQDNLKRKNKIELETLAAEQDAIVQTAMETATGLLTGDNGLEENNPRDLLVRYFVGYAKERNGDLAAAADKYRSVIDNDHRYRIAIARLGMVLGRMIERDELDDAEKAKAADAHLTKAQALNPNEPLLAYVLGRFLMMQGTQLTKADKMFAVTAGLKAPEGDPNLPHWAAAGRAAIAYADLNIAEAKIKGRFNNVVGDLTQMIARRDDVSDQQKALEANSVYVYCKESLALITENQGKRIVEWTFTSLPRTWKRNARNPMIINPRREKGLHFSGSIAWGGEDPDPLGANSVMFSDNSVKGTNFYEITYEGEIPEAASRVSVGVGAVVKRRARQGGAAGVQFRRSTQGTVEVRVEGARNVERLKANRALNWIELPKVPWAPGPFAVRISVKSRKQGTFRTSLRVGDGEWVDILESQFADNEELLENGETTRILTRGGGGGGAIQFYFWVEGSDGTDYRDIYLTKVKLVKGK